MRAERERDRERVRRGRQGEGVGAGKETMKEFIGQRPRQGISRGKLVQATGFSPV